MWLFSQKLLKHLSFPQTHGPSIFLNLIIWICLSLFVVFLKHHKPTACWPAWALILEAGRRLLFLTLFLGLFLRVWIFCKASEADRTPGWNEVSWPVLLQVPKYFVLSQILWSLPKIELHLVPLQIFLYRLKRLNFWNGNHHLVWHKKKLVWHNL